MALASTETYITVSAARAYAALFALSLPEADLELEDLLRRAAIYLDRFYGQRYLGDPLTTTQLLAFPRDLYTTTPTVVGHAQVELAAAIYNNDGQLPLVSPAIKKQTVKIEGLEESIEYADAEGYGSNPYLNIERILAPYFAIVSVAGTVLKRRLTMTRGE